MNAREEVKYHSAGNTLVLRTTVMAWRYFVVQQVAKRKQIYTLTRRVLATQMQRVLVEWQRVARENMLRRQVLTKVCQHQRFARCQLGFLRWHQVHEIRKAWLAAHTKMHSYRNRALSILTCTRAAAVAGKLFRAWVLQTQLSRRWRLRIVDQIRKQTYWLLRQSLLRWWSNTKSSLFAIVSQQLVSAKRYGKLRGLVCVLGRDAHGSTEHQRIRLLRYGWRIWNYRAAALCWHQKYQSIHKEHKQMLRNYARAHDIEVREAEENLRAQLHTTRLAGLLRSLQHLLLTNAGKLYARFFRRWHHEATKR
jgi:hypothetical protein